MVLSRRDILIAGAALLVAGLWLPTALGQEKPVSPASLDDPLLAAELLIIARKQIANSDLARQRTQNGDVRAFAEAEIAEHQSLRTRLSDRGFQFPTITPLPAAISGGAPVNAVPGVPGNPPPEPTANRPIVLPPGTRPANNAEPPLSAGAASPNASTAIVHVGRVTLPVDASRLILIETEIGEQNVATFRAELQQLAGVAFDKVYVGCQLHEHYAPFDRATVFSRRASVVLRPVLNEALPIVQRHITTLKGLMARLDGAR